MKKKLLIFSVIVLSSLFYFCTSYNDSKPNIILVMTDDQGYGDLGYHGHPTISTPNIDSFASEAVVFKNFLASPVCAPTRASLMTGRYNYRTSVCDTWLGRASMHPDEVTIAEILNDNGYTSGIFGKWHLGDNYPMRPQDQGFDEVLVHLGGGIGQKQDPIDGSTYFNPVLQYNGKETRFDGYCMDVYTNYLIQFIEQNKDEPFFAYLATNTPHAPWKEIPQKYLDLYKDYDYSDEEKIYLGMISNIDENFGRILAKTKELGIAENTIFIFMSDNGQARAGKNIYDAGLRDRKGSVYENGIRVPFFIKYANNFSSKTVERMSAHIDILPTLLELCNIQIPSDIKIDGRSLRPLITDENPDWPYRSISLQFHRGDRPVMFQNSAIRNEEWKLIHNNQIAETGSEIFPDYQLYNLIDDPSEKDNVANSNPDIVNKLTKEYQQWFMDVTSERGFEPHRILVGTEFENPVTLTRMDWRGAPNWQNTSNGYWRIEIVDSGNYDIRIQFQSPEQIDVPVFCDGPANQLEGILKANDTEYVFQNVLLDKGELDIKGWKTINNSDFGALRLILEKK